MYVLQAFLGVSDINIYHLKPFSFVLKTLYHRI